MGRLYLLVIYRIGSLEKKQSRLYPSESVIYRIGSLENRQENHLVYSTVIYRIGSLEKSHVS